MMYYTVNEELVARLRNLLRTKCVPAQWTSLASPRNMSSACGVAL